VNHTFPAAEIRVPGKWVLAGEHAVLRGVAAIALPHPQFSLDLHYIPEAGEGLRTDPQEAKELAWTLIDQVFALAGREDRPSFQGLLRIQSSIPYGAGLGSSAALCVAMVRWLAQSLNLATESVREIATRLEDRFHGKSSGMDIAVTSLATPIRYQIINGEKRAEPIEDIQLPRFTFHDTGLRKKTSEAISKVEKFRFEHANLGEEVDQMMAEASRMAYTALHSGSQLHLGEAMKLAQRCFKEWDLVPEVAEQIEKRLYREGARSVKLTGAGGGGFLVALWDSEF
jgi:mevalonate kinase